MTAASPSTHVVARFQATRWDAAALARAAGGAAVALALVFLLTAVTDEGGVPWGERAGRALPVTPVCAAIGAWAALAHARARGEALALEAMGRSPGQIAAANAVVAARSVDVAGFFPTAPHAGAWRWSDGAFVDAAAALRVGADGTPTRLGVPTEAAAVVVIPAHGRAAAAALVALAGVALPMLLARSLLDAGRPRRARGPGRRVSAGLAAWTVAGAAVAASVVLLQAAAVGRSPALLGAIPWAGVVAFALRRDRAGRGDQP